MKKPNLVLYIYYEGNENDIGYMSKTVTRYYTIHLYHEQNFPLKLKESEFWEILVNKYRKNKVRNFFRNI